MKMESYGFLAEGATVGSVEVVGCCLFSKSRSFTACFLQTMLHKQAWLTWYLRKLNNGRAHCSLQTGNNCAIALPGRWCAALPSLPEWVQEFVTEEQFHFSAQPVWWPVEMRIWSVWWMRSAHWCHPVWLQFCVFVQVRLGLQLPGPLCVLHHPGSSGILLLLPAHSGKHLEKCSSDSNPE